VDHDHGSRRAGSKRRLALVLALTSGFMVVEIVGGLVADSLALLSDAGHMLSDNASLAVALVAFWLADRPATARRTFGYKRAEILAALANGVALVLISLWIFYESVDRFRDPPSVLGGWMLVIALLGLAVNVAAGLLLVRTRESNLNMEAAYRHVLADLAGSVGVLLAAVIILATGWLYADPLISVLIAVLILGSAWGVIRDSLDVLLEATPEGLDAEEVAARMLSLPHVVDVHDLHVWTITSGFPALAAHVLVEPGADCHAARRELERMIEGQYGIDHTTLQVDHAPSHSLRWVERLERDA
jgi:cobalt-zinc-cadmium efflux system protein